MNTLLSNVIHNARNVRLFIAVFSCVLRDSTPRYVGPSVGRSVGPFYFFRVFELFEHTAPAQML